MAMLTMTVNHIFYAYSCENLSILNNFNYLCHEEEAACLWNSVILYFVRLPKINFNYVLQLVSKHYVSLLQKFFIHFF